MRRPAEVEAGGTPHLIELPCGHAALGKVAEDRLAAAPRGDQTNVSRARAHDVLDGVLVTVSLSRHDDHRAFIDRCRREVGVFDQVGAPAKRLSEGHKGVCHRGPADDHQVGCWKHRLDVDLERTLALTGDGYDGNSVGDGLTELLSGSEQQQAWEALGYHLTSLSDDRGLGASPADPAVHLTGLRDDGAGSLLAR